MRNEIGETNNTKYFTLNNVTNLHCIFYENTCLLNCFLVCNVQKISQRLDKIKIFWGN